MGPGPRDAKRPWAAGPVQLATPKGIDMTDQEAPPNVPSEVHCLASKDPAVRWFIFAAMLIGFGLWCAIDHYYRGKYNLPTDREPDISDKAQYWFNHYGPFVLVPAGLICLGFGVASLRRTLHADQEGIGYVGREKISWDDISGMDSSKLADKGILTLFYGEDEKQLVLDSWKLKNFHELIRLVEAKVPPDEPD
jgi:hypothetical protein